MMSSIQVQPQVFMVLCVISWTQSLVYFHKWRPWKTVLLGFATLAVFGGVEVALILTIRVSCVAFAAHQVAFKWGGGLEVRGPGERKCKR